MTREFVHTKVFERTWASIGCTDDELSAMQEVICSNPKVGDVISGTGGLRKLRIPLSGTGKSGGARVLYVDFEIYGTSYLIYAYPKNERANISAAEKADFKKLIANIENTLGGAEYE
jgi:Uncharacterized protein conserved in bacteria